MENRQITDFTSGSIPKHLITFAVPMFLGNMLQALYNTVDSIWVGRFLGPEALGAVSVGFPIIFALIGLVMGITMATTILVSQYFGAGQGDRVVRVINNSLLLLVVMGIVVSIIGVAFHRPLLRLINTPPEIFELASDYLGIYLAGLVGMFLYNVVSAILRGLGDSKTPLKFLAFATVLNIILDPMFIFGVGPFPRLGVAGVAWATVIAQGVSAVLSLHYLYRRSGIVSYQPGTFRFDWELTRLTFRIGIPAGVQQIMVSMAHLIVSSTVNLFGATVVAGFGAAGRLDQFAFMPAHSVSFSVSALVGQNLGAGKVQRVRETVRWGMLLAGGITVIVSIVALVRPDILMSLFTDDAAVLEQGGLYLRYMAFGYVPMSLMFTLGGLLRGSGDTVSTMLMTLVSLWIVRVPLARILSAMPTLGVTGVWIAMATSPLAGLAAHILYYRTGRWQTKAVTGKPPVDGAREGSRKAVPQPAEE